MKLLMLTLLLGLAYADLNSQNTGPWKLVKTGVREAEQFLEEAPRKFNLWSIYCVTIDCPTLLINIYVTDVCEIFSLVGVKDKDSDTYNFHYHGIWNFNFCFQSENSMVICEKYTDLKGVIRYVVEVVVRPGHELTQEENKEFTKWLEYYNIPEINVFGVIEEDS